MPKFGRKSTEPTNRSYSIEEKLSEEEEEGGNFHAGVLRNREIDVMENVNRSWQLGRPVMALASSLVWHKLRTMGDGFLKVGGIQVLSDTRVSNKEPQKVMPASLK